MHIRFGLVTLTAFAVTLGACTAKEKPLPPPATMTHTLQEGSDRVERRQTITVTAVVEAVDVQKRLVTLRGPDGNTSTIQVSDDVKNLPQVHKGDSVRVAYLESLAFQVRKPGEADSGSGMVEQVDTAKPGEKPAGVGARAVTVVTTVEGIDKTKGTITLKGPQGNSKTIKAQNPANLDKVAVGDRVEITYTEAVAISVEKP
jgi:ribosomal protein L35AE/L33A